MGRNRWSSKSEEVDQTALYMFGEFYSPREIHVEKDWAFIDVEVHVSPERDVNYPPPPEKYDDYLCFFARLGDTTICISGYDSYSLNAKDSETVYEYSTSPRFFDWKKVK